ncbi:unnamed protein product [Clonostachys solani]|uniref:Uncharacterized protein n=1 Tax=Clonostachys solani TaxID=160281 RepID=A0A9P0ELS7_9HYPO|nr:unnamed protein product [Clonostachys solani]
MADRSRGTTTNFNSSTGSTSSRPRPSATLAGVRRNLFQTQNAKPRRPVAPSAHSSETVRIEVEAPAPDSSEIVVRDRHGEIEFGEPPSPDLEDDEELPLDDQQETEQERQRLADAVKHHQINSSSMAEQPEELLEAVRASLRAKVAALSEDNWMYEPEEQVRTL